MTTSNLTATAKPGKTTDEKPVRKNSRKSSSISVKPALYEYAITRSGMKLEELAGIKKYAKLPEWISGEAKPTLRQLYDFSKRSKTPIAYFFLDKPPPLPEGVGIADFRVRQDQGFSSDNLDIGQVIRICESRQEWLSDYRREQEQEPLDWIGIFDLKTKSEQAAEYLNSLIPRPTGFRNKDRMLTTLIHHIEENGVMVNISSTVGTNSHRKLDSGLFGGFTLTDSYAPLIFINGTDYPSAKVFTVIHELAHLLLGETGIDDPKPNNMNHRPNEVWCNSVAGNYLVPRRELHSNIENREIDIRLIKTQSEYFNVSNMVIIRRLYDTRIFDKSEYDHFVKGEAERISQYLEDSENKKSGGGFFYTHLRRVGNSFANSLLEDTFFGNTTIFEAEDLLGISDQAFQHFSERLGYP